MLNRTEEKEGLGGSADSVWLNTLYCWIDDDPIRQGMYSMDGFELKTASKMDSTEKAGDLSNLCFSQ